MELIPWYTRDGVGGGSDQGTEGGAQLSSHLGQLVMLYDSDLIQTLECDLAHHGEIGCEKWRFVPKGPRYASSNCPEFGLGTS